MEEVAGELGDLVGFLFEGEVAGVEEHDLRVGDVFSVGLGAGGMKKGSFLPQAASSPGWRRRSHACQSG